MSPSALFCGVAVKSGQSHSMGTGTPGTQGSVLASGLNSIPAIVGTDGEGAGSVQYTPCCVLKSYPRHLSVLATNLSLHVSPSVLVTTLRSRHYNPQLTAEEPALHAGWLARCC